MIIGKYEIKWDGSGFMVGIPRDREREDGKVIHEILDPKYYGTLSAALESIPERYVRERFNACQDLAELRESMRAAAQEIVEPVRAATREALSASGGDDLKK